MRVKSFLALKLTSQAATTRTCSRASAAMQTTFSRRPGGCSELSLKPECLLLCFLYDCQHQDTLQRQRGNADHLSSLARLSFGLAPSRSLLPWLSAGACHHRVGVLACGSVLKILNNNCQRKLDRIVGYTAAHATDRCTTGSNSGSLVIVLQQVPEVQSKVGPRIPRWADPHGRAEIEKPHFLSNIIAGTWGTTQSGCAHSQPAPTAQRRRPGCWMTQRRATAATAPASTT